MTRVLVLPTVALLALVSGCFSSFDDGFFADDGGFDGFAFREINVERQLSLNLDELYPTQRYRFQITVDPPSPDAFVTARFTRVDGVVVSELAGDDFASETPSTWSLVGPGGVLTSFGNGQGSELYRLSASSDGSQAFVDVDISVTAPADVDFDGLEDDVAIDIGDPQPFFP